MQRTVNRKNKDELFRFVFGRPDKKKWLLSLYNAINHSHHENPDDITITTIESVVYMSMKNDLSFLIDSTMSFYEHQSSFEPNLPMRMLLYACMVYSKFVKTKKNRISLYSGIPQVIPVPKLVCLYNGKKDIGERMVLRLTEVLPGWEKSDIDASVLMLNINRGRNKEIMDACRPLSEYSNFIADVRQLYSETGDKDYAVETAILNLPGDSEVRTFLESNLAEVKMKCLTEYDAEREREIEREQYREVYLAKGIAEGRAEGKVEGADKMGSLMIKLKELGRVDDAFKAAADPEFRESLFKEFGLS